MDFKGKGPARIESRRETQGKSVATLDVMQQEQIERKRQKDQGLGPDTDKSDKVLLEHYEFLSGSEHFRRLARLATSDRKIILEDSSDVPDQPFDYTYYQDAHMIRVSLKTKDGKPKPLAEVREELLWEMRNASVRDQWQRIGSLMPSPASSSEEKEMYPYKMAAYALSAEWLEWSNMIEHVHCVQAINADSNMGEGGSHVTTRYGHWYAKADQGWYKFVDYLKTQIEVKHTTQFDPKAASRNWAGKHVRVMANKAALEITQEQMQDWQSGKSTKVMPFNNPFCSHVITRLAVKEANRAARSARGPRLAGKS